MEVARLPPRRGPGPKRKMRIRATCEQRPHQRFVTPHDRLMKRGEAGFGCVRVCALVEQEFDDISEAGMRGQDQDADAPGVLVVHVGTGRDEQLRRGEIARARGEHQRRVAAVRDRAVVVGMTMWRDGLHLAPGVRARLDVGAGREQHLDHLGMLLRHRPHERRLASRRACVHVGTASEQLLEPRPRSPSGPRPSPAFRHAAASHSDWLRPPAAVRTIAGLPLTLAVQSGVAPRSLAAFTLAPARISRSALSPSSR